MWAGNEWAHVEARARGHPEEEGQEATQRGKQPCSVDASWRRVRGGGGVGSIGGGGPNGKGSVQWERGRANLLSTASSAGPQAGVTMAASSA